MKLSYNKLWKLLIDKGMTKTQYRYIFAFSACIVMGMGEAALFSGSLSFFALVGLFMILSGKLEVQESSLPERNGQESIRNESGVLV